MPELPRPEEALVALARDDSRRPVLLALDFDGTLSPIVERPADARPLPEAIAALERLAVVESVHLALVSGRGLEELATVAGPVPEGTWLVGSHGAELGRVRAGVFELEPFELDERARRLQDELVAGAEEIAARHPGVLVQRKPTTVLVHTAQCTPEHEEAATREALELGKGHRTVLGKRIVEIAVHPAHKGEGVRHLRRAVGAAVVVYAGDDTTDEDAFAALGPADVGIRVGPGPTRADYRVASPADLATVLARFARDV